MTRRNFFPLIFVVIFNLWLIKIFWYGVSIGMVVFLASVAVYLSVQTGIKKYFYIAAFFIFLLIIFQYNISLKVPLVFLNEYQKIEQRQRMRGYPRELYRFANWLEQRKEAVIFYKIEDNFSEVVDPNLYFFSNHPRERVGVVEYEKFPYILLPFFVIGILSIKKSGLNILLLSISPLILLSLIGDSSPIGPFSLFPFLAVYTAIGLEPIFKNRKYLIAFLLIFSLVFIQTVSYATY